MCSPKRKRCRAKQLLALTQWDQRKARRLRTTCLGEVGEYWSIRKHSCSNQEGIPIMLREEFILGYPKWSKTNSYRQFLSNEDKRSKFWSQLSRTPAPLGRSWTGQPSPRCPTSRIRCHHRKLRIRFANVARSNIQRHRFLNRDGHQLQTTAFVCERI